MKKFFYALMAMMFLLGCTTVYEPYESDAPSSNPAVRQFVSFNQLQRGMTSSEVKAVLGGQIVVGYEMPDSTQERYKPVVINNPYRQESYTSGVRQYQIEYYLTGIQNSDDAVIDDELTPLVFEKEALIGWGWGFLKRIKD